MATTYEEEVLKRAKQAAQLRSSQSPQVTKPTSTAMPAAKPGGISWLSSPAAAGGLTALSQAYSEKKALDQIDADPTATALDKGAALGGAAARTMGAGAGAMAGGSKGAALGSVGGPIGIAAGGIIGAGLGGYLGSKAADMAIEGGKNAVSTQIGIPRNTADPVQATNAQGTDAKPYRDESLTATSARNLPAPQQPAMAATQPAQQGKDIGYGIRRIDAPGKSPLYVGDGPTPVATTQIMQAQPARRPVNMPVVGQGMGVFSSMANFANQAGNAMGAAMQNRASNRAAKAGLDAFRVQDEASTNDLRRQTAQAELTRAGQIDAARQEYLAAGDDPAKQKAAAKKLAVLSGKDGQRDNLKENFIVVGGGQEYDQAAQTMRNVPQTLVDLRTGQPVALPAQQSQAVAKPAAPSLDVYLAEMRKANPGKNLSDSELKARYEMKFGAQQ